jgi:hypothetical protein
MKTAVRKGGAPMEGLKPGWQVEGTYHEACAAEGQCPYYFGRDVEGGCRYYMVFRIREGKVNDVDLSGITVIYNGDILYPKYKDFIKKGSEGGVYVSDQATEAQRKVLDTLVTTNMGGLFMKKIFGVKYVKIDMEETDGEFHVKTPFGEMKQHLVKGLDGGPIRIENCPMPVLKNLKVCHTPSWTYHDHGKDFHYENRCGTWADFVFRG